MKTLIYFSLIFLFFSSCSDDSEPEVCDAVWSVQTKSNGSVTIQDGALVLSSSNPAQLAEAQAWQAPSQNSAAVPSSIICSIDFDSFFAGGNLSYDGYFMATLAYQKDPTEAIFKIRMWEKYVELFAGENYYTREITNRQARGNIRFLYGTASAQPTVGAVEYNPVNSTQEIRGNGTIALTNDPLMLMLEVAGSNFTPASDRVSINISNIEFKFIGVGTLVSDSFDCNSLID